VIEDFEKETDEKVKKSLKPDWDKLEEKEKDEVLDDDKEEE